MATIQDIPSTEAPAVSRGKIVANFEAINTELVAATAAVAGKEASGTAAAAISAHEGAADPHPNYALESALGNSALLNVGTTAGTVAAGDHTHAAYAAASHTHPQSEVTNLVSDLAAKAPTASPTFTGRATFSGHTSIAQTTMSGTEIDVTKLRQALTVSSSPTLTFAAGAVAGDVFGVQFIESGGVDRTITIPSSFSANRGAAITSFVLPANARNYVQWYYDGSTYHIAGDPVTAAQARTALSLGGAALLNVGTTAGTVAAGDDARLTDARTPTAHTQAASTITDFNEASRAQTEAMLVAGSNVTLTPGSSGATRTLTIASTGGGSGSSAHVMSGGLAATSFTFLETIAGGSASTDFTNLPVVHGSNASVTFA